MGPRGVKGPQYYGVGRVVTGVTKITLEFRAGCLKCQRAMLKYSYPTTKGYK